MPSNRNKEIPIYVCPICRATFKVVDPKASGVRCPGCTYLLKIGEKFHDAARYGELSNIRSNRGGVSWERDWDEEISETKIGSVVIASIIGIVVVAVSVFAFLGLNSKQPGKVAENQEVIENKEVEVESKSDPLHDEAIELLNNFFEWGSADKLWSYVDQTDLPKSAMEKFYIGSNYQATTVSINGEIEMFDEGNTLVVPVISEDRVVWTMYLRRKSGKLVIDAKSSLGINTDHPVDVAQGKKASVTLRAFAKLGNFYDFTYSERDWICIEFLMSGSVLPNYGYFKRDNLVMFEILTESMKDSYGRIILTIEKLPEEGIQNRFIVKSIESSSWHQPNESE